MVIKRVPQIDPEYITKRAIVSKKLLIEFSGESKKTTEKYLTDDQKKLYEYQQEKLRSKYKRKIDKKPKK